MNKDKINNIRLLGTLNNADESGIIANASQIYDANENKSTQDVSKEHTERIKTLEDKENELIAAVGTGGSVDTRITNAVNVEKTRAEGAESTLDGKITAEQTRAANAENALDGRVDTLEEAVGTGGSVDSKIASAVATETSRAQEAEANRYTKNETYTKEEVNNLITTPNQEYVSVTATDQTTAVTDVLPAIGLANTVYRVGSWDGSQYDVTKYSEYAWNGKDYVHLSTKTGETSAASDVTYNHNDSKLDATNVQQAIDEVYSKGNNGNIKVGFEAFGDLSFRDESGNVLCIFSKGNFRTKNFNSKKILKIINSTKSNSADFEISDEYGYVIVRFANGHIMTKNFDSSKKKNDVNYEPANILPFNLLNENHLTKQGVVLSKGSEDDIDSSICESPCVFYEPSLGKLVMIYTGYKSVNSVLTACHGYAVSDDGISWVKKGKFYGPSGISGAPDEKGTTGPVMVKYGETYYLFYIGLTETGYEAGTKTLCLATGTSLNDFINDNATRHGTVIASGFGWAEDQIWHPSFIKVDDIWYCFINATGIVNSVGKERIGYFTSKNLLGPWKQGDQILTYIDESTRGAQVAIDPSVISYGDLFILMYGTVTSDDKAYDHWAWTTKEKFPGGWQYGGVGATPTEDYNSLYAHKPYLIKMGSRIYHYYTAVGSQGRCIALNY